MNTFTVKAYTDYFGDVEPITVTSYDGDKYVTIIRADCTTEEIKSGYCYKNAVTYEDNPKYLDKITLWRLEGKDARNFKPRSVWPFTPQKYSFHNINSESCEANSLKDIVRKAHNESKKTDSIVEVYHMDRLTSIYVHSDGYVVEYPWRQRNMFDRKRKLTHGKFKKRLSNMLGYK